MPVSKNNYQEQRTSIYKLDEVKKTFRQYQRKDTRPGSKCHFLPEFLRIEKNNGYNTFSGQNNLLRFRDTSNWSLCRRLSLKPSGIKHFYYTDLFKNNKNVLCIVYYPKEDQTIELSIFPTFYPCDKSELLEKIKETVQSIAHKKGY